MKRRMSGDTYPRFRAAAVQAAPVFLRRDESIEKLEGLVVRAASKGANLIVFGESYIPAFPMWNLVLRPVDQHGLFRELHDNSIEIPSMQFQRLAEIAKESKVFLSVGITEKSSLSVGTLWNSNLLFNPEGKLINHRRKLVPTWAEKLTWANGDASGLTVAKTAIGRIGVLICGENTNTLARFALLAQGEQVHICSYPPLWPFRRGGPNSDYNLAESIRIRASAHSFEGKVFSIVAACVADEDAIGKIADVDEGSRKILESAPKPVSLIVGPTGELLAEPLVGKEGMIFADLDLSQSIMWKEVHDITGGYNRFDIFELKMNTSQNNPLLKEQNESNNNNTRSSNDIVALTEDLIAAPYSFSPPSSNEDRGRDKDL